MNSYVKGIINSLSFQWVLWLETGISGSGFRSFSGYNVFTLKALVIQIKYGLPYCVTCPSMSTDPGSLNPGMRRSRVVGSRDPYEYWGRWHSFGKTYLICIIAQVLENCFHTPYWHSVSEGGGVNSSWKWRPVIMSPAHNPLLLQLPILLHSMTPADI